MTDESRDQIQKQYWRATLRFSLLLLIPWFIVSFGFGILWRDYLDQFTIGTAPLGFWFAQQGSIICFVAIIFAYCYGMERIDKQFAARRNASADSDAVE